MPPPPPTTVCVPGDYPYEVDSDIVFVVEGSNDVTDQGFQQSMQFIKALAMLLEMGDDKARFAMVQYSSWPETEFMFKSSTEEVHNSIDKLSKMGWFTKTGEALKHTSDSIVSEMRPNSDKIIILLVANESQDEVKKHADFLKSKLDVKIYAVGVGPVSDGNSLEEIASEPFTQFVWKEASQDALVKIAIDLSKNVCEDNPPQEIPDPCNSDPCQNEGLCIRSGHSNYFFTCDCQFPFYGVHCENEVPNPCGDLPEGSPCYNNGTCITNDDFSDYNCSCDYKTEFMLFEGDHCEIEVPNPCGKTVEENPCENNGTCIASQDFSSYACNQGCCQ